MAEHAPLVQRLAGADRWRVTDAGRVIDFDSATEADLYIAGLQTRPLFDAPQPMTDAEARRRDTPGEE